MNLKSIVGESVVEYIDSCLTKDSIVGVGSGSTTDYFIDALVKIKHKFDGAVASSIASAARLQAHGIPVYELNTVKEVYFYVDGADESNRCLQLLKGGGGALTQEKIVASVAEQFICIVDDSKLVNQLGQFPLPIEVIPTAHSAVARAMVKLGGRPVYREGFVTDNGNGILDVHGLNIDNPVELEETINHLVGVVTNGLFARRPADVLLVGTTTGVEQHFADTS